MVGVRTNAILRCDDPVRPLPQWDFNAFNRGMESRYISSEWGLSDNNRKAKFYQLTRAGRKQIEKETQEWEQTTAILARFLNPQIA